MKANELRLNNLVYAFKTVWAIDNSDFSNLDKIETYEFIPLTEEWLLKAMFEKFDRHFIFKNNTKFFIELDLEQNYCLRMKITKDSSAFICQLDYVHQLQNAMFVFRVEELVFFSTEP